MCRGTAPLAGRLRTLSYFTNLYQHRTCPVQTCERARSNLGRAARRDIVIAVDPRLVTCVSRDGKHPGWVVSQVDWESSLSTYGDAAANMSLYAGFGVRGMGFRIQGLVDVEALGFGGWILDWV